MGESVHNVDENHIHGRLTANARHLHDPENKVYYFDMEGILYEVDVNTLEVEHLFTRPIPGWHAKGAYSGQGRLVLANNGEWQGGWPSRLGEFQYQVDPERKSPEDAGALGVWDGEEDWKLIHRRQFTEVSGPGGIYGPPDDDAPVWAIGWDRRSLILAILENGEWHEFRLPKADYSYDGHHGWHTEWPRIREAVPADGENDAKILMNKNGGFFHVPPHLTASDTSGFSPVGSYLKIISDIQPWQDNKIVFACNETSHFDNPAVGRSQSNLWFSSWDELSRMGQPAGWGGIWMEDPIAANRRSSPFLIGGYSQRVLHLAHTEVEPVTFSLEVDASGRGEWQPYSEIEVQAGGYDFYIFGDDIEAQWIRISADRDVQSATAYFHFGPSRGAVEDSELLAPLAKVTDDADYIRGIVRPAGDSEATLHMMATRIDSNGDAGDPGFYVLSSDMVLSERTDLPDKVAEIEEVAAIADTGTGIAPDEDLTVSHDEASVIVTQGDRRFRLPKSHAAYDETWPGGGLRGVREVVTERSILSAHGTFYMLPRNNSGGVRALKPISTHNRRIVDWCSWRGMLVLVGVEANENRSHPNVIRSEDGQAGVWLGDIDDLWKFGKPVGYGGPWRETAVVACEPSDPYLMTGYDKKTLKLSHDSEEAVTFRLEVDVFGAVDTPNTFFKYDEITVAPGETIEHRFSDGFAAHWIRFRSNRDTNATATLIYE